MLSDFFSSIFDMSIPEWMLELLQLLMWIAIAVFVVIIIIKELGLFNQRKDVDNDDAIDFSGPSLGTAEDADIRGHNLVKELQEALRNGDFALAVHLRYLMALQCLNNKRLIEWRPFKTPLMYVSETKSGADTLRDITIAFLYIKYGHYPASQEVYDEVTAAYDSLNALKEGGTNYDA